MKKILSLILVVSSYMYAQFEIKNSFGLEYKHYIKTKNDGLNSNKAVIFNNEMKYSLDNIKFSSKIEMLKDFDEKQRDHINLNELYLSLAFDDFDLDIGKKVIFLGSLEAYNLSNILNHQNYQRDPISDYKKGAYLVSLNYYLEDEQRFSVFLRAFEEDIKIASKNSPYYPYGDIYYDSNLLFANEDETPSLLALYEKTYDEDVIADTAFGFFYGYDETLLAQKIGNRFHPFLFQSMKAFTFNTFVVESMLYKLEASYSKVIDDGAFDIKDFYKIGFGGEYTVERIVKNHNLGLILEYYKSDFKYTNLDNDIFLALRYSFNDKDSNQVLLGAVKDLENTQGSLYLEYSGRLTDTLSISLDMRYIKADKESFLGEHIRLGCEIKYYF